MLDKSEVMGIISDSAPLRILSAAAMSSNRSRLGQSEILLEISRHAITLEDLGEFLRKAAEILRESCDYDLVQIWTLGPKQEDFLLSSSVPRIHGDPIIGGAIPTVVEERRRQSAMAQTENPGSNRGRNSTEGTPAHQLTLPLRYRGKLFGLLSVETNRSEAFPPEQNVLIEKAASVIAAAFDKFNTIARASRSYEYLQAILNSASDLAILSTDSQGYVFNGSSGIESVFRLPLQSILGRDILTLFSNEGFRREVARYLSKGNAPMLTRNRLEQATDKGKRYLDVSFQRMSYIGSNPVGFLCLAIDVTANVLLQQKLETLSVTDDLTGLFNRRHMMTVLSNEMKRSRRFRHTFSLCFFDLDGFKKYNDTMGHLNGDKMLISIANLMRSLIRANVDSCYRFGGDELAILMPETSAQKAVVPVEKILTHLRDDFEGTITASVGIAEFDPALQEEGMLEMADRAMYQAKAGGGNQIVLAH